MTTRSHGSRPRTNSIRRRLLLSGRYRWQTVYEIGRVYNWANEWCGEVKVLFLAYMNYDMGHRNFQYRIAAGRVGCCELP